MSDQTPPHFFQLNYPFVVSELIDGESVIMNLKSGNYYSARHTGALLWAWLEQGWSQEAMLAGLAEIYGGAAADYTADADAFIVSLREQDLVSQAESQPADGKGTVAMEPPARYKPPQLEVFADLQDLLLLDPIHDIDEVGWPVAKPTRPVAD